MLILSRNVGQKILVGDDIEITITGILGGQVRVGIDAPKEIEIDREEIRVAKQESGNVFSKNS